MISLISRQSARLAGLYVSRLTVIGIACLTMSFGAPINSATSVLGGTPLTTFEGFAEGTLIQNQIAGVTFGQTPLAGRPQIDNFPFLFGYVASSGVGVLTGSLEGGYPFVTVAGLTMTFSAPVAAAEVFFSDNSALGSYTISAFDTNNVLLESFALDDAGIGIARYVGFQYGSAQISRFAVGPGSASNDAFAIDDLRVVADAVPEPSSWALMAMGAAALAALRRRR